MYGVGHAEVKRHRTSAVPNICVDVSQCQYYDDGTNRRAMTRSFSFKSKWQSRHLVSAMQKYGASSGESMVMEGRDKNCKSFLGLHVTLGR